MTDKKTKKLIVYPAGIWAKKLLTLSRSEQIAYFVDDKTEGTFPVCGGTKNIHKPEKLTEENKDDIIILISDTHQYIHCKQQLESMGFIENVHFFNAWKLHKNYYRQTEGDMDWLSFEKNTQLNHDAQNSWEDRAQIMASLIPDDVTSIMDIGCGNGRLKKYLNPHITYYGLDYEKRDENTIICDINKEPLPDIPVDAYYMAGLLLYVDDIHNLIYQMQSAKYIIFSYEDEMLRLRLDGYFGAFMDFIMNKRTNYLSLADIINILCENGFVIDKIEYDYNIRNSYHIRAKSIHL